MADRDARLAPALVLAAGIALGGWLAGQGFVAVRVVATIEYSLED